MEFVSGSGSSSGNHRRKRRTQASSPLTELFLDQEMDSSGFLLRLILWIVFVVMGLRYLAMPLSPEMMFTFWHNINLPFHEAGHVLFGFLPPVMVSLMGSGLQLIMPAVAGGTLFVKNRDIIGASLCLWWVGQNFLDIAPYIDDAMAGELPLLGGNYGKSSPYGFHDWEFILGETGMILKHHEIALGAVFIGKLLIVLSLIWGGVVLFRTFSRHKLQ